MTEPSLLLNPGAQLRVLPLGKEREPLLVVDNVLGDMEALVDIAARQTFVPPGSDSYYPGLNARLPAAYIPMIMSALAAPLTSIFSVPSAAQQNVFGFFGLATTPREAMSRAQAAPHIDAFHIHGIAGVHYLTGEHFGGTAFYKHKATGFERISPSRSHIYQRARKTEIEAHAAPIDDLYEEIAYFDAVPNRLLVYRAGQLHSARLAAGKALPTDVRNGRLTANFFFNVK